MSQRLTIRVAWEHLAKGLPEERATFAALGISFNNLSLTEAEDGLANRLRQDVYLSGYRLGEWLAWNWWRLRWEPRKDSLGWAMAHRMASIGGGYIWPNITIFSDGERVVLNAQPTSKKPSEPLRYIAQTAAIVSASEFESEVDLFLNQTIERLRSENIEKTNLDAICHELREERRDPELAKRRKLEALLGRDVDEANQADLDQLLADATRLGEDAVGELAAQNPEDARPLTSGDLASIAISHGFDFNPADAIQLESKAALALPSGVAAWERGVAAAKALRKQLNIGAAPISNDRLSEMVGVSKKVISSATHSGEFPFTLESEPRKGKISIRSKYETGRRFALCRLLGDRIAYTTTDKLRPATSAYTYRQKIQRAFAGEFLCPFKALQDMLHGDLSDDQFDEAADYFNVSNRTIRTLLVNNGLLERDNLELHLASSA
ncbi:MAG TPA: hypothetical protein PKE19_03485 [Aestuariivirga sp.]|nr:hypothetical protein [Aestuariivirga sp.]